MRISRQFYIVAAPTVKCDDLCYDTTRVERNDDDDDYEDDDDDAPS